MKIYQNLGKFIKNWQNRTENDHPIFVHHTGAMFGIGALASDRLAIERINRLKHRESSKKYIVLFANHDWLNKYQIKTTIRINRLLQQLLPGEVTFVLPCDDDRLAHLTSKGKIAIRIPTSPFLREAIEQLGEPIISTSINKSDEEAVNDLKVIESLNWADFALVPPHISRSSYSPSTIITFEEGRPICLREGSLSFEMVRRSYRKPLVMFICSGNICRSPMAEYYFRQLVQEKKLPFRTTSAGFIDTASTISEHSQTVLAEDGIDASQHFSKLISPELTNEAWLILTMTKRHKTDYIELDPNVEHKVFTISEYLNNADCGHKGDIEDPYGLDIYFYRQTYKIIKCYIEELIKKIAKE